MTSKRFLLLLLMLHISVGAENIPFIDAAHFVRKHHRPALYEIRISLKDKTLPDWMLANIQHEMSKFTPFSAEELERCFLSKSATEQTLVHFRIRGGKLFVRTNDIGYPPPMAEYTAVLYKILQQPGFSLANGDFLMAVADGVGKAASKYPIWCFSKHRDSNYISVPDVFALGIGRLLVFCEINRAAQCLPWASKINKAFWIGGPNGGMTENNRTWKDNPRVKLVLFSLEHPDILWARLTHIRDEAHICSDMRALDSVLCSDRITPFHACRHKYLIDVDGVSSAFHRCQWVLRSNCASVKEDSGNVQWYYSGLKPFVHYVPYQTDCSDLENAIQWLQEHDEEAKKIAEEGRKFSIQYLNTDMTYLYLYHVMREMIKITTSF